MKTHDQEGPSSASPNFQPLPPYETERISKLSACFQSHHSSSPKTDEKKKKIHPFLSLEETLLVHVVLIKY